MSTARYQIFDFPPDWSSKVTLKYRFNSSVFITEQYAEQRKPLKSLPCTNLDYTILAESEGPQILDYLRASLNSIMFVPIWTEPIITTDTDSNLRHIDCQDVSSFFNLQLLAQYLVLIDRRGTVPPALSTIRALGSDSIDIVPIAWDYDPRYTLIYPAMLAILESFKKVSLTTEAEEYQVSFKEYSPGVLNVVDTLRVIQSKDDATTVWEEAGTPDNQTELIGIVN